MTTLHFKRLKSCGCMQHQLAGKAHATHGATDTPEYAAWSRMKQRCYNPKDPSYRNYGARGIQVCALWRNDFEIFLEHVGYRPPQPKGRREYSLDRINNNGHYEPGNVRWATARQQHLNTGRNRLLEFRGKILSGAEWAEHLEISAPTIYKRLNHGWSVERALTQPVRVRKKRGQKGCIVECGGLRFTITEWAKLLEIPWKTIWQRLAADWPVQRALTQKVK